MTATVSELLQERRHAGEASNALVSIVSFLAHASFFAFLAMISKPKIVPLMTQAVPVRIISPAALGSKPGMAAATTAPKARPVIEKMEPPVVKPSEEALPLPKKTKAKPEPAPKPVARSANPTTGTAPAAPALELPAAGGNPSGEAAGTSNFGASVSSFDTDFPFAYYVEQLQSLIGANWLKPDVPEGTACVVAFKIQRSGQITDVKVETSSGLAYYDRAASRSLYAANPLPPLPPEYRGDVLGVHLRFQ